MGDAKIRKAAERTAQQNLSAFVESMRRQNPLGVLDWDAMTWEFGKHKRTSAGREDRIWFNCNFVKRVTKDNAEAFPQSSGDLLRAIVCSRELGRPRPLDTNDHMVLVRAFRYLYSVARSRAADPTGLRRIDFDEAAVACRHIEADSSAYRIGCKLQEIARVIDREYLAPVRLNWVNPISRDTYAGGALQDRTSDQFFERRLDRLPTDDIMDALADISNRSDLSSADLLRQRAIELFLCGGFRCNELLTLPRDTWVEEAQVDVHGVPVLDRFGQQIIRSGLRYIPEKRRLEAIEIKWLPTAMVDVARRAIGDILSITAPFVEIARYMNEHPGSTILPEPWHSMDDRALLSMAEVASAIGITHGRQGGYQFARLAKLPLTTMRPETHLRGRSRGEILAVEKRHLVGEIIRRSSASIVFPDGQVHFRLHECLFVIGVNFVGGRRSTLNGTATLLTQGQIDDYLSDRSDEGSSLDGTLSIFSRLKYVGSDGTPIRGTTHQFRHWLNNFAHEGGLSQLEISRWMGRKSIKDNSAYDHQTGFELAKRTRERLEKGEMIGSVSNTLRRIKNPVRRAEFVNSAVASTHVTDLGMCIQDLSAIPCDRHRDCVTCNEHLLEKGNQAQRQKAQDIHRESALLLRLAEAEQRDGSYGADNWLEHQMLTLKRATAILAVHNDESIPDGTLVQIPVMIEEEPK
ncbi:hypothetical protein ACV229_15295 [Burkholderia sp. MR1-5-21]